MRRVQRGYARGSYEGFGMFRTRSLFGICFLALSSITAPDFGYGIELLQNGDFEDHWGSNETGCVVANSYANWTNTTNWDETNWVDTSCSGDHGAHSPGINTFACTAVSEVEVAQIVDVTPNSVYSARVCWAAEGFCHPSALNTDVDAELILTFFDGAGGTGSIVESHSTGRRAHTGAQQEENALSLTGMIPSSAASLEYCVRLTVNGTPGAQGVCECGGGNPHWAAYIHRASFHLGPTTLPSSVGEIWQYYR